MAYIVNRYNGTQITVVEDWYGFLLCFRFLHCQCIHHEFYNFLFCTRLLILLLGDLMNYNRVLFDHKLKPCNREQQLFFLAFSVFSSVGAYLVNHIKNLGNYVIFL